MRIDTSTSFVMGENEFHMTYEKWGHHISAGIPGGGAIYYEVDGVEIPEDKARLLMEIETEAQKAEKEYRQMYETALKEVEHG